MKEGWSKLFSAAAAKAVVETCKLLLAKISDRKGYSCSWEPFCWIFVFLRPGLPPWFMASLPILKLPPKPCAA